MTRRWPSRMIAGRTGSGTNSPPVITSLSAQGTRPNQPEAFADLNEQIVATIVVEDAESPIENLVYEWSAASGTFEGTGATVQWRAPQVFGLIKAFFFITPLNRTELDFDTELVRFRRTDIPGS